MHDRRLQRAFKARRDELNAGGKLPEHICKGFLGSSAESADSGEGRPSTQGISGDVEQPQSAHAPEVTPAPGPHQVDTTPPPSKGGDIRENPSPAVKNDHEAPVSVKSASKGGEPRTMADLTAAYEHAHKIGDAAEEARLMAEMGAASPGELRRIRRETAARLRHLGRTK